MSAYELVRNQANLITFVMIDSSGGEVAGLGTGFTLEISKAGGAFASGAGTKAEMGGGWYSYEITADEADSLGPVAVKVTGAGAVQQNLEYVVRQRTTNAIKFTYTVDDGSDPIEGAEVSITRTAVNENTIWNGTTDAFGVARDVNGEKPWLDAGTYYFWTQKTGISFTNPDTEIVS